MFLLAIIASIFLFISFIFGTPQQPEFYSPCSPPIHYKIGNIDKRFRVTDEKILKHIDSATRIWENAASKDIFVFDEDGIAKDGERMITVNMVYDERQRLQSQINQLESQVSKENKKVDANIAEYEARVKSFNERSVTLSERIKNLNINDSDYKQKFDEVFSESQTLNSEADELNKIAASLNQSTDSYNQQVAKLNNTVSRFNAALAQKPEEGIYNSQGDIIEIFITDSDRELIHTLAHEFGHSLGIDHTENKEAIMYPFSSQFIKPETEDINAIAEACKERVRE